MRGLGPHASLLRTSCVTASAIASHRSSYRSSCVSFLNSLPTMPKPKSARRGRRSGQGPVRRSSRQSTRASTRSSQPESTRASTRSSQPESTRAPTRSSQPESTPSSSSPAQLDSLADLLSLVREQVRAEVQAQQAYTGQTDQHSLSTSAIGNLQATTNGHPSATSTQPATGTPVYMCE